MYISFHLKIRNHLQRLQVFLSTYQHSGKTTLILPPILTQNSASKEFTNTYLSPFLYSTFHLPPNPCYCWSPVPPKGTLVHGQGEGVLTVPSIEVVSMYSRTEAHIFQTHLLTRDPQTWQWADSNSTLTLPAGQPLLLHHIFSRQLEQTYAWKTSQTVNGSVPAFNVL